MGFDYARRLLASQPDIDAAIGVQHLYADGAVFVDDEAKGIMTSRYYCEESSFGLCRLVEQFQIHMPRERWFGNLDRTLAVLRLSMGGTH